MDASSHEIRNELKVQQSIIFIGAERPFLRKPWGFEVTIDERDTMPHYVRAIFESWPVYSIGLQLSLWWRALCLRNAVAEMAVKKRE